MADENDAAPKGGKVKKKALITVAIVAGVMVAEGGAVFIATRWLSPGLDPAAAGPQHLPYTRLLTHRDGIRIGMNVSPQHVDRPSSGVGLALPVISEI